MGFVAVEQAARAPIAVLEPAFPGAVDAGGATSVGRRGRDGDAFAGDEIIFRSGLQDQAAMLAGPLLGARRPRIDEGHGEAIVTERGLLRRVVDAAVECDDWGEAGAAAF